MRNLLRLAPGWDTPAVAMRAVYHQQQKSQTITGAPYMQISAQIWGVYHARRCAVFRILVFFRCFAAGSVFFPCVLEKGSSGFKSRSREKVGMTDVEAQISADEALARRIQVRQRGTGQLQTGCGT